MSPAVGGGALVYSSRQDDSHSLLAPLVLTCPALLQIADICLLSADGAMEVGS